MSQKYSSKIYNQKGVGNVTAKVMTVIKVFIQYLMSYNKHEGETIWETVHFLYLQVPTMLMHRINVFQAILLRQVENGKAFEEVY